MERRGIRDQVPALLLGGALVLAGFMAGGGGRGDSGRAIAAAGVGAALDELPSAYGVPNGGFAVVAGANGKYFFVNEDAKVRALSTDGGEILTWK